MKIASWQWKGRTKEGAPRIVGTVDAPPRFSYRLFFTTSVIAGLASIVILGVRAFGGNVPMEALLAPMIVSGVHGGVAAWLLRTRRRITNMVPAEELEKWLGVDADEAKRIVEEREIRPRYNINGRDFYERADFGDVATLLRSAAPPVNEPTLLRPAANTETPADRLLRAAPDSEEPKELKVAAQMPESEQQIVLKSNDE